MEMCGSIFTNSEYTEFNLQCMYCSTENDLKDWEQFALHVKNFHFTEDVDKLCVKSENETIYPIKEEFWEETEPNEEDVFQLNDTDEFDAIDEIIEEDVDSQSSMWAEDSTFQTLDNAEQNASENESSQIDEEFLHNTSDNYEKEIEPSSSDSDNELEEIPRKRSRTNPLTLKRKLKISFLRHNPRILHFIEEFKKHPCLWNNDSPLFYDESARAAAYNVLAEFMDKKVNVLFTEAELKKSIEQLLSQYEIAAQNSHEGKLTGLPAQYFKKCKFLSATNYSPQDDEECKSDIIELNFKTINDITTSFIDAYANFPVLYDNSLPEFKSVDARSQAYINMSELLAPQMRVNETEVHLAVMCLRKWAYMTLRRVKSKLLQRPCSKTELHYLQLCSFLPPKAESFVVNCEYCDKRFFIDYSLRSHMFKAHNVGELPYLCSQCPRRFDKAHDMERHKLRQHCEKMLKCDYCDSKFAMQNDLNVHIRCHTGEKPFVCELCGKSFRLKLLLDYHINGSHLNLRPFACDLCPKKFHKRVQLKNHMKGHMSIKDKVCEQCGAAFTCPTSLSRHRKTHQKQ